jgi:hypothetical protein
LFEKRGFSRPGPHLVQALEHQGPTRQGGTRGEEQKESQQHRYVDRYRAEGVMRDGPGLFRCKLRPLIIVSPRAFVPKPKAASKDIGIAGTIGYAN